MTQQLTKFFASRWGIIMAGTIIGLFASFLQFLGNPPNMGICVACFERDIAGALGLHRLAVVQYIRPEIIGFVLGSLIAAFAFREFKSRGGSAPIVRFVLGVFAMIGALVFLGCSWRAILRFAGGDLNAIIGLAGLVGGTFFNDYSSEIFLGMVAPLLLSIVSVLWSESSFKKSPQMLTNTLIKTFIARAIFFALYFILIFTYYDFEQIPFIISFTSFFMIFYAIEALFLQKLIKSKN